MSRTCPPDLDELKSARSIDADSARIHYHAVGDGPPLLMLPAFGPLPGTTAWLTYEAVLPSLSLNYRCLLVDYPNFGRSSAARFNEPVHDLYARQAFAVLDAEGVDLVRLVGVSTGGTVALRMALRSPERVSTLAIASCDASTGGDPYTLAYWPTETARLFQECQSNPADRSRIRRLLESLVYDASLIDDRLVESLYQWRVREPEHSEAWSDSTIQPHSTLGELATLQREVLVLHGRYDRMVPLEAALRLVGYLPKADLVVLGRCGHWLSVEQPQAFSRHLMGFFEARDQVDARVSSSASVSKGTLKVERAV